MHISDADLRAFVDNELAAQQRADLAGHLKTCPGCQARLEAETQQAARARARLAALAPASHELPPPAHIARRHLYSRQRKESIPMLKSTLARRPLWAGLAVLALLAVAFSFAPVRAWAGQFLGLFRVQQIRVLPLDTTGLSALANNATLSEHISLLFGDGVTVVHESADPVRVASAGEASALAGFDVRSLSAAGEAARITVRDRMAFDVVADRDRAQAILNEAGRDDLQLPAAIDGATISVDVPTGVTFAYGQCPPDSADDDRPAGRTAYRSCVLFAQVPSPSISAPPDLDVGGLAEIALQFVGLSAEEARDFSATVDWTSTLVVPLPRDAAAYETVTVDGVAGTLIYEDRAPAAEQMYMLMWVKDEVVYALQAFGGRDHILALANSIR